jgi:hypothetical protein
MDIHNYTKKKRNTEIHEELKASNKLKRLLHIGRYENTMYKRVGGHRWSKIAWNYKFTK